MFNEAKATVFGIQVSSERKLSYGLAVIRFGKSYALTTAYKCL
jgi:hypothetical protein